MELRSERVLSIFIEYTSRINAICCGQKVAYCCGFGRAAIKGAAIGK